MDTVIVLVVSISLDTFTETEEGNGTASLVMKQREVIIAESHTFESVHRSAALSRVAAGLPCLG
jgi:hypothetical protein